MNGVIRTIIAILGNEDAMGEDGNPLGDTARGEVTKWLQQLPQGVNYYNTKKKEATGYSQSPSASSVTRFEYPDVTNDGCGGSWRPMYEGSSLFFAETVLRLSRRPRIHTSQYSLYFWECRSERCALTLSIR